MESAFAVMLGYMMPGFAIAIGLMVIITRFGRKRTLWLLGHPLMLEIVAIAIAWAMHGGTIVGGMAVVVAGICIHITVSFSRACFGYIKTGTYHPGWIKYDPRSLI